MRAIGVLTVNAQAGDEERVVKTVEDASEYFPADTWESIQYLGELRLKPDVQVAIKEELLGALLLEKLVAAISKARDREHLVTLLLGITLDPVIAIYCFFNGTTFRRTPYLIHDYVAGKTGIVSLFQMDYQQSSKVVAHGLGHNRGLRHHMKPIDLMYSQLLNSPVLQVEGFCTGCLRKLAHDETTTLS